LCLQLLKGVCNKVQVAHFGAIDVHLQVMREYIYSKVCEMCQLQLFARAEHHELKLSRTIADQRDVLDN